MEPTAQTLARTYSDRVYPDPWEKVLDYRRVQAYIAEHPNAGRVRVGNALELPNERVRGWMQDMQPDPVRGIQTAIDHGWLDPDPDSKMAAMLVELLGHVLAGGSITTPFTPAIAPSQRVTVSALHEAFDRIGVDSRTRHADDKNRATEVVPTRDASVLGRCLVAMGAPQGDKTTLAALPSVIQSVPVHVQRSFVTIYIAHRGPIYQEKSTTRFKEARPASYHKELIRLIQSVVSAPVTYSEGAITVSAAAMRELEIADMK